MNSNPAVRTADDGPVRTIILERREARNAVDGPTARDLQQAFEAFEADETARVAVLWGAGGTFCAGADLKAFGTERQNVLEAEGPGPMGPTRMTLSKPVIAAIEGYAVAGGLELACWCDLRVAAEDATLGVFCRRFGVPLIDGGTVRLPQLIGLSRALDLILTGRPVSASEAQAMGLVNRLVAPGEARAEAERLAQRIAEHPQACLLSDRRSAYESLGQDAAGALAREFELGARTVASGESATGARRFTDGAGRHGSFDG